MKKVVDQMKERAKIETTAIPKIYSETLRTLATDANTAALTPTLNSIKTTLYHSRRQRLPHMPDSADDLDFTRVWVKTDKGEPFFQGTRDGVFMFAIEENLRILSEAEVCLKQCYV